MCFVCVCGAFLRYSGQTQLIKLYLLRNFDLFFLKIRYFKRSNSDWCFNGMIYHLTYTPTTMHYSIINKKIVEVYFLLFSFNIIDLTSNELRNQHFLYPRLFTVNQLCIIVLYMRCDCYYYSLKTPHLTPHSSLVLHNRLVYSC